MKVLRVVAAVWLLTAQKPLDALAVDGMFVDRSDVAEQNTTAMAEGEAISGYVDGTDNAVSWTYDLGTKTVVVTGTGTRVTEGGGTAYFYSSCFPAGVKHIRFENCRLEGAWDYMFKGLADLVLHCINFCE